MNKYIDIANAAGNAKTVRATGVAAVAVDDTATPDTIIIQYANGSKWTIFSSASDFTDADALKVADAIVDTASTNWREVSSTFSGTLSQPILSLSFTF